MTLQTIVGKALATTDAGLNSKLKVQPLAPLTYTKQEAALVAELRRLALADASSAAALRASLTVMVADFLEREARVQRPGAAPFWQDLAMTPTEVARVFVEMVGENPKKVLSKLPRGPGAKAGTGREGNFNGWLFQQYMLHHVELHKDLVQIAGGHVLDLNGRLAASSGGLFDALGTPLSLAGQFGPPCRATDFWLSKPRTAKKPPKLSEVDPTADYDWDEFMDGAYIAPLLVPGQQNILFWTIAVGLEVKRPLAAAADLSRQVGEMFGRMQDTDMLRMTLDGSSTPVLVPTRAFVFSPESRWLVGATRSLHNTPEYDFVSSTSGGYPEAFLRLRVRFDTGPLDRLSGLLFRARLKP